jgi:hypothetical protein
MGVHQVTRSINHRLPVLSIYSPPATRGDCIDGTERTGSREERTTGVKQCGAFACPLNLLVTHSADCPGRRHGGLAPPWTLSGNNTSASAPSCALDVVDAHPHGLSSGEVAKLLGVSKRDVELVVAKATKDHGAVRLMRLHSGVTGNGEEG